jgi:hypothetical protein
VPEVALAAALAVAKAAVQEPGGVDQEGLRERQSRFKFGKILQGQRVCRYTFSPKR